MERYEIVVDDEGNYCGLIPSENGSVVKYADAQATVEALQRERDEANLYRDQARANQESLAACVDRNAVVLHDVRKIKDLQAALDAEREKVKQVEVLLAVLDHVQTLRDEREKVKQVEVLLAVLDHVQTLRDERDRLARAIVWALGYTDFRAREQGEGAYWWRTELRLRAKLTGEQIDAILAALTPAGGGQNVSSLRK